MQDTICTTGFLWHSFFSQAGMQDHRLHRFSRIIELHHGIIDDSHLLLIEVLPRDQLGGNHDCFIVDQHGSDNRAFRLLVMRHDSFDQRFLHDICSPMLL